MRQGTLLKKPRGIGESSKEYVFFLFNDLIAYAHTMPLGTMHCFAYTHICVLRIRLPRRCPVCMGLDMMC